jgi:hypothetical protein
MEFKEGLYYDVSFAEYLDFSALSSSDLVKLMRSPAHLKYSEEAGDIESDSTIIGRAIHAALLEPDKFVEQYEPVEKKTRRKPGELELVSEEKTELKKRDYLKALEVAESLRAHKSVFNLLAGAKTEVSAVWRDEETEVWCKARFDIWDPKRQVIADLKTTTDARAHKFSTQIFQYRYYLKAQWYINAAKALGFEEPEFIFIAAEKAPPFAVGLYTLKQEVLDLAQLELADLVKKFKACITTNQWPAYPDHIDIIGLPEWGKKIIAGNLAPEQEEY